jgi:small subunit ribosomal protein S16
VVKIRLQRRGRKKLPVYKIVASDSRSPRNGRFIEQLGQYAPLADPATVTFDQERVMYWLKVGAQPTDTVKSLLSREGVMLRIHLMRKGKTEEEIGERLAEWMQQREARAAAKSSKKQRRAEKKKAAEQTPAEAPAETPAAS